MAEPSSEATSLIPYRPHSWGKMTVIKRYDKLPVSHLEWQRFLPQNVVISPFVKWRTESNHYGKSTLNIHCRDWCWSSNTLATWCEELTRWKRPWCWERLKAGEGGNRGWDCWMASLTQWTWVWVSSRRLWRTGKTGKLQSMGSQRVGHDSVTEQQLNKNDGISNYHILNAMSQALGAPKSCDEDFIIINFTMSLLETKASQPLNSKPSQQDCWFSTLNSHRIHPISFSKYKILSSTLRHLESFTIRWVQ